MEPGTKDCPLQPLSQSRKPCMYALEGHCLSFCALRFAVKLWRQPIYGREKWLEGFLIGDDPETPGRFLVPLRSCLVPMR